MLTVSISALRADLLHYLEQASQGEEIVVTSKGKELARIVPPFQFREKAREQLKALRNKADVGDVISPIDEDWEANQ